MVFLTMFKTLHVAFCDVCSRKVYAIKESFIICIIMTGSFGALEQSHGKFLPRCNIDTVSDYWDFENRPETQRKR